jgi:hypothetical protein
MLQRQELEIVAMNSFTDKSLQNSDTLQNVNAIERAARIIIGFVMIAPMFFYEMETVNIWLASSALLGVLPVLSGMVGWCPTYAIFSRKNAKPTIGDSCYAQSY